MSERPAPPPVGDDEAHALVDGYLDGALDEAGHARLSALVVASPAVAERLIELAAIEGELRRREAAGRTAGVGRARAGGRRWALPALVLGVGLAVAAGVWIRRGRAPQRPAAPAFTAARPVAPPSAAPNPGVGSPGPGSTVGSVEMVIPFQLEPRQDGLPWTSGARVACPPDGRPQREPRCLASRRMRDRPEQFGVTLGDWHDPFLSHDDGLVLRFEYWIGETTTRDPELTVAIHGERGRTYRFTTPAHERARWVRVETPLREARYWHAPAERLRPGERISALHFNVPWSMADVFFLRGIEVVRRR